MRVNLKPTKSGNGLVCPLCGRACGSGHIIGHLGWHSGRYGDSGLRRVDNLRIMVTIEYDEPVAKIPAPGPIPNPVVGLGARAVKVYVSHEVMIHLDPDEQFIVARSNRRGYVRVDAITVHLRVGLDHNRTRVWAGGKPCRKDGEPLYTFCETADLSEGVRAEWVGRAEALVAEAFIEPQPQV